MAENGRERKDKVIDLLLMTYMKGCEQLETINPLCPYTEMYVVHPDVL
jgi:hypothetical protein